MIYVKSVVAGLIAVILAIVLLPVIMGVYFSIVYRRSGNVTVGWDPISLLKPSFWCLFAAIFGTGFLWEFRRATKSRYLAKGT